MSQRCKPCVNGVYFLDGRHYTMTIRVLSFKMEGARCKTVHGKIIEETISINPKVYRMDPNDRAAHVNIDAWDLENWERIR